LQKFAKSSLTQPEIARFRSNFVDFGHVTPDVLQIFKVNESEVKVTALHNLLASQIVTFYERIGWLS